MAAAKPNKKLNRRTKSRKANGATEPSGAKEAVRKGKRTNIAERACSRSDKKRKRKAKDGYGVTKFPYGNFAASGNARKDMQKGSGGGIDGRVYHHKTGKRVKKEKKAPRLCIGVSEPGLVGQESWADSCCWWSGRRVPFPPLSQRAPLQTPPA